MKHILKSSLALCLFVVSFVVLLGVCLPIPPYDVNGVDTVDVYEYWAHQLGHGINSVWVAVSLLLLVLPTIRFRKAIVERACSTAWWALDVILCDFLLVDVLGKDRFSWGRPNHAAKAGFPSGHATFAFALAWLITEKYPKLGVFWYAMAVAISWSRVEVHAHYNYQVFAGAGFGALIGWLVSHREGGVLVPRLVLPWPKAATTDS